MMKETQDEGLVAQESDQSHLKNTPFCYLYYYNLLAFKLAFSLFNIFSFYSNCSMFLSFCFVLL